MTGWQKVVIVLGLSAVVGGLWPLAELYWRHWWDRWELARRDRRRVNTYLHAIEPSMAPLPRRKYHHGKW